MVRRMISGMTTFRRWWNRTLVSLRGDRAAARTILLGVCGAAALLLLVLALVIKQSATLRELEGEKRGAEILESTLTLFSLIQSHRGASLLAQSQNLAPPDDRAILQAIVHLDGQLPPQVKRTPNWRSLYLGREDIGTANIHYAPEENLTSSSRMLQLLIDVADETGLMFDPAVDTFYLMDLVAVKIPRLLDQLAYLQGIGTIALIQKQMTDLRRYEVERSISEIIRQREALKSEMDKLERVLPDAAAQLRLHAEFDGLLGAVLSSTRQIAHDTRTGTLALDYHVQLTTAIEKGNALSEAVLQPLLKEGLQRRSREMQLKRLVPLALGAFVLYVLVRMALALIPKSPARA